MPYYSFSEPDQIKVIRLNTRPQSFAEALGGDVDLSYFKNLTDFEFDYQKVTSLVGYKDKALQLTNINVTGCQISDELPTFGSGMTQLAFGNPDATFGNSFTGRLTKIINNSRTTIQILRADSLKAGVVKNDLFGVLPIFSEFTAFTTFNIAYNSNITGSLNTLVSNTALTHFDISGTGITTVDTNFEFPTGTNIVSFKANDLSLDTYSVNKIVEAFYARWSSGGSTSGNGKTFELGSVKNLTVANFNNLETLRGKGWTIVTRLDADTNLLDTKQLNNAIAAFSTRRLKGGTQKCMKIRRTTDDVTADVNFDTTGKISLSSTISNVSNGKTYETLKDFTEEVIVLMDDFGTGSNNNNFSSTPTIVANSDGSFNFSAIANSSASTGGARLKMNVIDSIAASKTASRLSEDDSYQTRFRISGSVTAIGSGNNILLRFKNNSSNDTTGVFQGIDPSTGSAADIGLTTTGDFSFERLGRNSSDTSYAIGGLSVIFDANESISINNFKVEAIKHRCTIETWYNQVNSNANVTQSTFDEQPGIIHDGAVLVGGARFGFEVQEDDESVFNGDRLASADGVIKLGNHDAAHTFVSVITPHNSSAAEGYIGGTATDAGAAGSSLYLDLSGSNLNAHITNKNSVAKAKSAVASTTSVNSQMLLTASYNDQTTAIRKNGDGSGQIGSTTYDFNANGNTKFVLGNRDNKPADDAATAYKGDIQEFILFDTDKSGLFTTIETNAMEAFSIS